MFRLLVSLVLIAVLSSSCALFRRDGVKTPTNGTAVTLPHNPTLATLYDSVQANKPMIQSMSIKFAAEYADSAKKQAVKGSLKIKRDSAVWISVTPFGIEAARVLMTPDSLKMINKLSATYYKGSYAELSRTFGIELNFNIVQALLLNELFLYPATQPLNKNDFAAMLAKNDSSDYFVEATITNNLMQLLGIGKSNNKLIYNSLTDLTRKRALTIKYSNFQPLDNKIFPVEIKADAFSNNARKAQIALIYEKISLNTAVNTPFDIPSTYKPMKQ